MNGVGITLNFLVYTAFIWFPEAIFELVPWMRNCWEQFSGYPSGGLWTSIFLEVLLKLIKEKKIYKNKTLLLSSILSDYIFLSPFLRIPCCVCCMYWMDFLIMVCTFSLGIYNWWSNNWSHAPWDLSYDEKKKRSLKS